MIHWVLRDIPQVMCYIDDVLVVSSTSVKSTDPHLFDRERSSPSLIMETAHSLTSEELWDLHVFHVCHVLDAFRRHKMFVKGSKMHLFMFCGYMLSNGQRRAAPSKLEALRKWTREVIARVTHLKGVLGLAHYDAIYMKYFA